MTIAFLLLQEALGASHGRMEIATIKASEPANKDYYRPASVQSAKNLQTSILPAYNM